MAIKNRSVIVRSFTEAWDEGYFVHTLSDSETLLPGTLVYQSAGGLTLNETPQALGQFKVNADVNYPPQIVVEDELQGKTIDDVYASGDHVRVKYLGVGERYVVYSYAGETVAVGALLSPHTDGTVIANTGPGDVDKTLFRAETAVAGTDTGADRRLVVTVLRV